MTKLSRTKLLLLLSTFFIYASACSKPTPAPSPQAAEPETLARTEFSDRVENYFEYEPLRAGKPSPVRIHLTDLSDGSPIEKAEVTLVVTPKGAPTPVTQTVSKIGKVTGIYVAELTIQKP